MEWKSATDRFTFSDSSIKLCADPDELKKGISAESSENSLTHLFSISDPDFVEQSALTFHRGNDLFTVFQKANHTAECYWRLDKVEGRSLSLESIVSLRSSHLETETCQFELHSQLDENGSLELINQWTAIYRSSSLPLLFLIHPDDANEVRFSVDTSTLVTHLSVPLLERGVIRRTRTRAYFCEHFPTEEEVETVRNQFASSEIPLTT